MYIFLKELGYITAYEDKLCYTGNEVDIMSMKLLSYKDTLLQVKR
jgi:hypothetical protein